MSTRNIDTQSGRNHKGGRLLLRFLILLGLSATFFFVSPDAASAHTGVQSYVYLDVTDTSLSGRIEVPVPDLAEISQLSLDGTDAEVIAAINGELDGFRSYFDDHLLFEPEGARVPIKVEEAELFFSDAEEVSDNYVVFPFSADFEGEVPRVFDLTIDIFLDEIEGRENWLIIGNDWQAGVIDNGFERFSVFDADNRKQEIDLGDAKPFQNFFSSMKLGVKHIQTGPDHILFVMVLLLPSVLVLSNGWKPAASFSSALWRVLKIVTMFTVAHSITFTLAGLGILPLPSSKIVESIIALSIAVAALHNIRPLVANKEWLISFAFGLFHGMGFASLVDGLDIDRSTQLVSLLGRNVGIEIGQAAVVVLLFPALFLLRRTRFYQPFLVGFSVLLALISLGWMVERLAEVDLGINGLVEPVFAWPNVLFYVAAVTALAAGVWYREKSRDELQDLYEAPA